MRVPLHLNSSAAHLCLETIVFGASIMQFGQPQTINKHNQTNKQTNTFAEGLTWFRVYGLWFRVYGLGFRVYAFATGLTGFMVYGLWFMV